MDERIREAFDSVQASEGLKARTRARIAAEIAARRRPVWRRRMVAVAVCLCLMVACIGGAAAYFTPTASIAFEGDSSIEMAVNCFQRVLWVEGKNEAGCALADSLSVRFMRYTDAVEQVLASEQVTDELSQQDGLSITVIGDDEAARTEMLNQVRACTEGHSNVHCAEGDAETAAQASALGLPLGKYRLYQQLLAAGDSITAEQAGGMTMQQLRERLAALGGQTDTGDHGAGSSNAGGNGSGNGNPDGSGYGQGSGAGNGAGHGAGHGNEHGHGGGYGHE